MGKAKMVGQFKPFLPNSRADMRRRKRYTRSREYTDRHEEVMAAKRGLRYIQKREEEKRLHEENSYDV